MDNPKHNTHGTPGGEVEADTASGGAPEDPDNGTVPGTEEQDAPVENPSGG